ncbi:MAG: UDP-N-acetylmuramate dehydrogenase [bacterium]|nr:UDP-N-acetylmuramate dehydrogenase [bacterium]
MIDYQQFERSLTALLPREQIKKQEPMKKHTTFRVGGCADYFVMPHLAEVQAVVALCREYEVPFTIIGNGSNLLVSDAGLRGVVLQIGKAMSEITVEGNVVRAQAGAMLSETGNRAAKAQLTGMEFAAGIPGSIGGAVVMNAGAYGGEMKDILTSVIVLTADGNLEKRSADELELSYRHSKLMADGSIVLEASLQLEKGDPQAIRSYMDELRAKRIEKQPLEYPSAGSTFKRPEGYFAGKLIQDANLSGYSVGGAQVSTKHCGFVINRGDASASDIMTLIKDVQKKVFERNGVWLETEVRLLGDFS